MATAQALHRHCTGTALALHGRRTGTGTAQAHCTALRSLPALCCASATPKHSAAPHEHAAPTRRSPLMPRWMALRSGRPWTWMTRLRCRWPRSRFAVAGDELCRRREVGRGTTCRHVLHGCVACLMVRGRCTARILTCMGIASSSHGGHLAISAIRYTIKSYAAQFRPHDRQDNSEAHT